jgi:hypothetical protein
MKRIDMRQYGLNDGFVAEAGLYSHYYIARIVSQEKGAYQAICENGTHTSEPGCAISEAIANGELSPKRWDSYCKLKTEAAFADDRSSYMREKEKKFKNIAKINKSKKKQ